MQNVSKEAKRLMIKEPKSQRIKRNLKAVKNPHQGQEDKVKKERKKGRKKGKKAKKAKKERK